MQIVNNEISIQRGEGFTLDLQFKNKDDSPFVIPLLENPYFLVTVTSSKMRQTARYIHNIWCKYEGPIFYSTEPIMLTTFSGFSISSLPQNVQTEINNSGGRLTLDNYAIYASKVDGELKYKYCKTVGGISTLYDYSCDFIVTFEPELTKNWLDKEYWYSITLLSGLPNPDANVTDRPLSTMDYNKPMISPTRVLVTSNSNNLGGL